MREEEFESEPGRGDEDSVEEQEEEEEEGVASITEEKTRNGEDEFPRSQGDEEWKRRRTDF